MNIYERFDDIMVKYRWGKIEDKVLIEFLTTLSRMCETFLNDGKVNYYEILLNPVLSGLESDDRVFKNRAKTIVRRVGTYLEQAKFSIYSFAVDFLENIYNNGGEEYMSDYFKVISRKLRARFIKERVEEYRFLSGSDKYYKKHKINYKEEYVFRDF